MILGRPHLSLEILYNNCEPNTERFSMNNHSEKILAVQSASVTTGQVPYIRFNEDYERDEKVTIHYSYSGGAYIEYSVPEISMSGVIYWPDRPKGNDLGHDPLLVVAQVRNFASADEYFVSHCDATTQYQQQSRFTSGGANCEK